jgi:hypothetical protein
MPLTILTSLGAKNSSAEENYCNSRYPHRFANVRCEQNCAGQPFLKCTSKGNFPRRCGERWKQVSQYFCYGQPMCHRRRLLGAAPPECIALVVCYIS